MLRDLSQSCRGETEQHDISVHTLMVRTSVDTGSNPVGSFSQERDSVATVIAMTGESSPELLKNFVHGG